MRLPFLFTLPRVLRHSATIGADLVPDEAVVVDSPDAALRTALAAATAGDHGPARDLLAATRAHAQWELRDGYVARLADGALHNPGWLDAWLAESPEDPDAALVKADLCIGQAWEIRTPERARSVSRDQFQAFFALLEDAVPVIGAAAGLNPADPVPWRIALTHALGSQAPRAVFDDYWAEATARDPHHYGCHTAALQYLCAKWYGSHEEMFAFAEGAAATAPPGSKLHALPLSAALEYEVLTEGPTSAAPDPFAPRVAAAVTRALALSAEYAPGSREAAGFRNQLALMLLRAERWHDALDTFRAIGATATTYPWAHFGDDPRQEFLDIRSGVRIHVATRTPFFSRPSHPQAVVPAPVWTEGAPCALAIAAARPAEVAQAALMCGVSLRTAPASATHTYIEAVPDPRPAKRSVLSTEDRLTTAADNFTTGEKWPTLVLRRAPERCGFTLFHKGRPLATHEWNATSPSPDHTAAAATAAALCRLYDLPDPRPLTHILRATGNPPQHQSDLLAALALPPLPADFGTRPEILDTLPGARVLTRRGLLAGIRDTMTTQDGAHPSAPGSHDPHPARWWLLRIAALPVVTAAAVYCWSSPGIGPIRAAAVTSGALLLAGQLTRGWHQRRTRTAKTLPH